MVNWSIDSECDTMGHSQRCSPVVTRQERTLIHFDSKGMSRSLGTLFYVGAGRGGSNMKLSVVR